jgi:endoglucanase
MSAKLGFRRRRWLLIALVAACSERPPRAVYPAEVPSGGDPDAAASEGEAPAGDPEADAADVSGTSTYPATPRAAPPVLPPVGQGLKVPLQRYIIVDQFGYRSKMAKVAILADPVRGWNEGDRYHPGAMLEVRQWSDAKVVWQGAPVAWNAGAVDQASGDRGKWLDFSSLITPGLYYVFDPQKNGRSQPFEIADDVYRKVLRAATKMFYFNRANFAKVPPYSCTGNRCWSLGADYVGPGQDKEARSVTERGNAKTARDLSGGWWDAGDPNKYVTFSHEPVHQLLTAYEEHAASFGDDFAIPESGNGVPDLIDEILVEIAWLKKMQPADLNGGALIKLGVVDGGDAIPDQSRSRRYYYPEPCSSATIDIAGEFAHAALVLKAFPRFASEVTNLTARARDAWKFFHSHTKSDSCDDGTIRAGDADRSAGDQAEEAVVSAVYLFALTGDAEYGDYVAKNYAQTKPFKEDRWSVYAPSQGDALLYYAALSNAAPQVKQAILSRKLEQLKSVDLYRLRPELDLYRAYMRPDSYHWGSNNQRAAVGNTNYDVVRWNLVPVAEQTTYLERAAGMLHSFHGVNPLGLVYLTNMYAEGGDACADELFHTWFRKQDPRWGNARTSTLGPAPGYVPGGPNKHYCEGQDPGQHACARSPLRDQPSGKAYVDTSAGYEPSNPFDKAWELSEPGIYYQASYVRLVSKFVN